MKLPMPTLRSHERSMYTHGWLQLLLFLGWYGAFHYAYFQIPDDVFRELYHRGLGTLCADLINLLAPMERVSAVQNRLVSPQADLEIVRGCDGAGALFLLISAILAFPSTITRKWIGIGLGVSLMYGLNLIRISGLYFVIAHHRDWFQLIHTYLAPTLIIVIGCLFFAGWAAGALRSADAPR
jgi:exosortase family protein XrtM